MAAEIVYKKWFGGKRTKIVMGVLVFSCRKSYYRIRCLLYRFN